MMIDIADQVIDDQMVNYGPSNQFYITESPTYSSNPLNAAVQYVGIYLSLYVLLFAEK